MPVVYADGYFYVIGGRDANTDDKTIGRLDATTMVWSKSGELVNGRWGHNAIYNGSNLIVVGGNSISYKTENCVISNNQVSCTAQNPSLTNYSLYPELFLVPVGFCKTSP